MELKDLNTVDFDLKDFAYNIIKYQNFQTNKAVKKIEANLKTTTKALYFNSGVRYIKTGIKNPTVNKKVFEYIDLGMKECLQPLTPSENDKRRVFKNTYHKKDVKLPVQETLKKLSCNKLTERFEYGVRYDDTIKIFSSSHDAKMFLNGIRFVGKQGRLVSIQDIKED